MQAPRFLLLISMIVVLAHADSIGCSTHFGNAQTLLYYTQEAALVQDVFDTYLNMKLLAMVVGKINKDCVQNSLHASLKEELTTIKTCKESFEYVLAASDNTYDDDDESSEAIQQLMNFSGKFREDCIENDELYTDVDSTLLQDLKDAADDLVGFESYEVYFE